MEAPRPAEVAKTITHGDASFRVSAKKPDTSLSRAELALANEITRAKVEHLFGRRPLTADVTHFTRADIGDILTLSDQEDSARLYVHNKEAIYSSEQNGQYTFASLADFLSSPTTEQVQLEEGNASDIALFGTINSNLQKSNWLARLIGRAPKDWMRIVQRKIARESSFSVFNPNLHTVVEADPINMAQFAKESHNLFNAKVVVMNFESRRGGLALAELRMAMLASILTGHTLLVNFEKTDNKRDVIRSRAVALADIEFFREKFGDNLHIELHDVDNHLTPSQLAKKAIALASHASTTENSQRGVREIPTGNAQQEKVVLSGSSADATDMAMRMEVKHELARKGIEVTDTYVNSFSGTEQRNEFTTTKQSRKAELDHMLDATDHLVYAGNSLSPFGELTTALLFALYNGSRVSALVRNDDRDGYSTATYRSHSAKALMSYQLAKVMHLVTNLEGVEPQLQDKIKVIANGIDPVVASFAGQSNA